MNDPLKGIFNENLEKSIHVLYTLSLNHTTTYY